MKTIERKKVNDNVAENTDLFSDLPEMRLRFRLRIGEEPFLVTPDPTSVIGAAKLINLKIEGRNPQGFHFDNSFCVEPYLKLKKRGSPAKFFNFQHHFHGDTPLFEGPD